MMANNSTSPVIAGIDGSQAALNAAQWAVDEAVVRGVPLRLVYVTKPTHASNDEYYEDVHRGEAALKAARSAVEATGKHVDVETAVIDGPPALALIEQSREADLVCVGSVGIGRYARSILGSTATELAEKAHCPVAVIRPSGEQRRDINWIVVAVNDEPGNEGVVEHAMREAGLRHAPVLVLGDRKAADTSGSGLDDKVSGLKRRYPDVHVYPIANKADVAHFLKKHDERVQLAVIASSEADELAQIVGRYGHPVFHHANSSALIVR